MATQAKITSTEALETFRAALIIFLAKARRSLDDSTEDVRRVRQWLQHDQRMYWEGEHRRRMKQLNQAQQELMSARFSMHQQSAIMTRQMAVTKAQQEVAEVETKLKRLKAWTQNYDSRADPLLKRMDGLRQKLAQLNKATNHLFNIQSTLEAYAESSAPLTAQPSMSSSSPEPDVEPGPGGSL